MNGSAKRSWSISIALVLVACGSSAPVETSTPMADPDGSEPAPEVTSTEVTSTEVTSTEPDVSVEAPPQPSAQMPSEQDVAETEPSAEAERLGPFSASTADEVHQVVQTASTDVVSLRRLIDTTRGVGTVGPGEAGMRHYCDAGEITTQPSLEFVVGASDTFRCDRQLRRCTLQEAGAGGYAFHFRSRDETGGAIFLDTLIHYDRRVPTTESRAVRSFLQAGDGVCVLHRALGDASATPPARFSVLVTAHTGIVPETLSDHHCGDAVAGAYRERVTSHAQGGAPDRCDRDPTRCAYRTGDEDITIYGDDDGPFAVTVTRHGMRNDLDRAQQRELATFLTAARRHTCAD